MGSGEYGGNGSIHWKVQHGNGRTIISDAKTNANGIDDDPKEKAAGGDFTVVVEDVNPNGWTYDTNKRTLTVKVPIKHGTDYTKQVSVSWPK